MKEPTGPPHHEKIKDFMVWDHDRLEKIFDEFKSKLHHQPTEADAAFQNFKEGMKRHFLWEEDTLFPLYESRIAFQPDAGAGDVELTAEMRDEHREIRDLLEETEDKLSRHNPKIDELIHRMLTLLKATQHKEVHVLHPWIDDYATPEQKEEAMSKITHSLVSP